MSGRPYTPEEQAAALRVYIDEGPDAAAVFSGASVRTIYTWAVREGVSTTAVHERTMAATSAAKERAALLRAELRSLLMEQTVKALHAMDEDVAKVVTVIEGRTRSQSYEMVPAGPADKKDLALVAGILIDKFRLETGEATARNESRDLTGFDDHELAALRAAIAGATGPGPEHPEAPAVVGAGTNGATPT